MMKRLIQYVFLDVQKETKRGIRSTAIGGRDNASSLGKFRSGACDETSRGERKYLESSARIRRGPIAAIIGVVGSADFEQTRTPVRRMMVPAASDPPRKILRSPASTTRSSAWPLPMGPTSCIDRRNNPAAGLRNSAPASSMAHSGMPPTRRFLPERRPAEKYRCTA